MKKRNIIGTSLLAIAMAGSVLAGSTYALFQISETNTIDVTSGSIAFNASINNIKTYSGLYNDTTGAYDSVLNEGNTFSNGGTVSLSNSTLTIKGITPMDKVTGTAKFVNKSTVRVKYRTVLKVTGDSNLFQALKVDLNGNENEYDGTSIYSTWQFADPGQANMENEFLIELPESVEASDSVMGKRCSIKWSVEAVQANVHTEDVPENVIEIWTPMDLVNFSESITNSTENVVYADKEVRIMSDINMDGVEYNPAGRGIGENPSSSSHYFGGTLVGYPLSTKRKISYLTIENSYYTTYYGYGLFYGLDGATIKNIDFNHCTINTTNANMVGMVAGYTRGNTTLDGVNVNFSEINAFGKVGGLIGSHNGGYNDQSTNLLTLNNCSVPGANKINALYNASSLVGLSHTNAISIDENTRNGANATFIAKTNSHIVEINTTITTPVGKAATAGEEVPAVKGKYLTELSEGIIWYSNIWADYYTGYFWCESVIEMNDDTKQHKLVDGAPFNKPSSTN